MQADLAADAGHGERPGARPVGDVRLQIEVVEDPVEQRDRAGHLRGGREGLGDRLKQPRLQRGDSDDRPGGEALVAVRELQAGHKVNEHGSNREERRHDGEERAADQLLTDRQGREAFIFLDVGRR